MKTPHGSPVIFHLRSVALDQIIPAGDIGDIVLGNRLAVTGDADSWYDAEDPGSPWNLPVGLYLAQFHLYIYDNEGVGATEAMVEGLPLDRVESSTTWPIESNGAIQTEPVSLMFYTDFFYIGAFIVRIHATGAHDIGIGAFDNRSWVRLAKLA